MSGCLLESYSSHKNTATASTAAVTAISTRTGSRIRNKSTASTPLLLFFQYCCIHATFIATATRTTANHTVNHNSAAAAGLLVSLLLLPLLVLEVLQMEVPLFFL